MSIVKELDKVSGTDTRSKNIEVAVKKLKNDDDRSDMFVINFDFSSPGVVAADKTPAEFRDAMNAKKHIVAFNGAMLCPPIGIHDDGNNVDFIGFVVSRYATVNMAADQQVSSTSDTSLCVLATPNNENWVPLALKTKDVQ